VVSKKQVMNSREKILSAIRSLSLEPKTLPDIPNFSNSGNLVERFTQSISDNKGEVLTRSEFDAWFAAANFSKVISLSAQFTELGTLSLPEDPHDLESLEVAILDGKFGVAENGAIWLEDTQLGLRALPFATEHLVIVLDRNLLENTMHQGYEKIAAAHSGFGLFLAGPSKTADIEQSLVIGAQGARSLRVVLI
jgi:L-lactate dehydrogenase complex protein LldG